MIPRCRVLLAILLILTPSVLLAENKQQIAESLISRANQLSNIRADGTAAFRLTAKFSTVDDKGISTDGTYEEIWDSKIRVRREISLSNFHLVEVIDGRKRWTLSDDHLGVGHGRWVEALTDLAPADSTFAKPDKIMKRDVQGSDATCVITKPNAVGGRSALCFDQKTGLLLEQIHPYYDNEKIVDEVCRYTEYHKVADRVFPHSVQCFREAKQTLAMTMEIAPFTSDAQTFIPPDGAIESANCMGSPVLPPKALYTPDPSYPKGQPAPKYPVVLWMMIGTDGKPKDIKVARTVNNVFDSAAKAAVGRWNFQPATCDGQPVETQINVEVSFRTF